MVLKSNAKVGFKNFVTNADVEKAERTYKVGEGGSENEKALVARLTLSNPHLLVSLCTRSI